jgi:dihydroxy-acid dehydratase
MTALYLERYLNYGLTIEEQSDRPIIGIAQTGSDLSPATATTSCWPTACATASARRAAFPSNFPATPSRKPASAHGRARP